MQRFEPFHLILANNLVQNVVNFTVWFALVFWAFLETRSVFVTGTIGGIYLVITAGFAIWFGSLVDHHRKKRVMLGSSVASGALYGVALAIYALSPADAMAVDRPALWVLVTTIMLGVICGNLRLIALPTLVTALIEEDKRDKANGLVGMVTGIGWLLTSGLSGFLVAWDGIRGTLIVGIGLTAIAFLHLLSVRIDDPEPASAAPGERKRVDLKGTVALVTAIPGLIALILFSTFNNFLGGVFMALMDGYGLSLMKVEEWGLLWALASASFILSGIVIARRGLGANPLRTLILVNFAVWTVAAVFTLQSSVPLLAAGCVIWLFLGPFAEAAEHTTMQKVVPYERQGRVFGFAQSIEQSASPFTAFLIGPLTQFVAIPFMSAGGAGAAAVGGWYGVGPERGMALVFTVTGLLGLVMTAVAFRSRQYRQLSAAYAVAPPQEVAPG